MANNIIFNRETTSGFLTENEKKGLIAVFSNKEDYIRHMQTLWALRAEVLRRCEVGTPNGITYDKGNPLFRLGDLANELIGALGADHNDIFFEDNGHYREYSSVHS